MKRMRFICCLIAVLTALFVAMPVTASAANGDGGNWTVSSPEELKAAIAKANGGEITHITLTGSVTVTDLIEISDGAMGDAEHSGVTIDLNGFTLTASEGLTNEGNLTITGKSADPDTFSYTFNGTITNHGTLTITDGQFCAGKDVKLIDNTGGKLTITGGVFTGKFYVDEEENAAISGGQYSDPDVLSWLSDGYTLMCHKDLYTVIKKIKESKEMDAVARQMCGAKYKSGGIYYWDYDDVPSGAKPELIGYYVDFNYIDASGQLYDDKCQEIIVGVGQSVNDALKESERVVNTEEYQMYSEWDKKRAAAIRNPSLAGYSFKGWYEPLDYEWTNGKLVVHQYADTAFNFDTKITAKMAGKGNGGITLVSVWEKPSAADDSPDTGDDFNIAPPIALMLLAAAAGAGAIAGGRRKIRR